MTGSTPRPAAQPVSMPHRASLTTLIACLVTAPLVGAGAQSSPAPAKVPTSTQAGVYTAQQAARGRNVYAGICSSCHSTSTHTGAPFLNRWGGQPISELYALISETMPQMEPASLSKQEYIDVVAYLLQLNKMPAGEKELTADPTLLRAIRIDTAAAGPPERSRR